MTGGPINRNSLGKALWPGLNKVFLEDYNQHPLELTDLFDTFTSNKAFEEDIGSTGLGMAALLGEGASVTYDTMSQGFLTRYTHLKYGTGYIVTPEVIEDVQYSELVSLLQGKSRALAFPVTQTQETVAANVYNRAFNSTYKGGDNKELLATDHPNVSGGTYANELSTAADLSEASLEQAVTDLMKFTNDRGHKVKVMPKALIIPVDLWADAERILKSPLQSGNSNNDINALKMSGYIPKVIINHYLTDTDAFFIRTTAPEGMKRWVKKAPTFTSDNDFETDNLKFKVVYRESYGWSNPKALFGSPGA